MLETRELRKQILFEDLEEGELERLTNILKTRTLKKGEPLFKEDEEASGIYMIVEGKIKISKTTLDGWTQTLAMLSDEHFFGELSILEDRRHDATAEALEETTLIILTKEDFERMEKEESHLAFQILKKLAIVMSKNVRRMNNKFLNALINY